ncbi:hypothetical protein R8G64_05290 [Tenacibaculum maritimum]|uniref:hypothetical protein n=1 Tax=Tenacibaculum maritimum TaxID=107401 RepID=UPI0012E6B4AC|nr:hypothetical protein [Tenacibaculum maritimum]CAA0233551.1 hypothetical protein DPIF8902391_50004 [Tenacibaculum maritimum]
MFDLEIITTTIELNKNRSLLLILSEIQEKHFDKTLSLEFDLEIKKWTLKGGIIKRLLEKNSVGNEYSISSTEVEIIKNSLVKNAKEYLTKNK